MKFKLLIIFVMIFLVACKENKSEEPADPTASFEDSFKEKMKTNKDLESEILFDEKSKIYTNNLYNISMDFPDHWEVDMGTSENSLVRGVEKDSGMTFIVVPIEIKKGSRQYKLQNQLLDAYNSDKDMYEKVMSDNLQNILGKNY